MHTVEEVVIDMIQLLEDTQLLDEGERVEIGIQDGQYYWKYFKSEGTIQ